MAAASSANNRDEPQVVLASPTRSPLSKKMRKEGDTQPDEDLEELLAAQDSEKALIEAGAPAWAIAFQSSIRAQVDRQFDVILGLGDRVKRLEEFQRDHQDHTFRLEKLEQVVESLKKKRAWIQKHLTQRLAASVQGRVQASSPGSPLHRSKSISTQSLSTPTIII